jgi:hypothetical protein
MLECKENAELYDDQNQSTKLVATEPLQRLLNIIPNGTSKEDRN